MVDKTDIVQIPTTQLEFETQKMASKHNMDIRFEPSETIELRIDNIIVPITPSVDKIDFPIKNKYVVEFKSTDDKWFPLGVYSDRDRLVSDIDIFLAQRTEKIIITNASSKG